MLASAGEIIGVVVAVVVVGGGGAGFASRCLKIVQQGSVGVVKRLGQFRSVDQPGLRVLRPFVDKMEKVDMREFPMTGDQQSVITKDNVSLWVSATIFCQVIDVKSALFEINDYQLAVDQLSRTALRAVFGELSLDQALSERETINSRMQDHMADATLKWGVRLNRIDNSRHHTAHQRHPGHVRAKGGRAAQARRDSRSPKVSSRPPSTAPGAASRPPCSRPRGPKRPPSCGPRPK